MSFIPFAQPSIELDQSDLENIKKSINSGWFHNGKYIQELEKHFREKFNVKYAIACANATSGLIIAFKALNIESKVVAIPSFTWPSTEYAIRCSNNIPLWCDINLDTWNVNLDSIKDIKVDAIMPVDVFGNNSYIEDNSLPVIYDAAHGYGIENLGNRGNIEVISLSFTKMITGMQGSLILFNNDNLYEKIRELVNLSAKLCEVNAFIALKSIKNYKYKLKISRKIIKEYKDLIEIPYKIQKVNDGWNCSVFSILLKTTEKRDKLVSLFKKNEIEIKQYYKPLIKGLPNTDNIYSRIISLPVYETIVPKISKICNLINKCS